ncbi:MAG: DNA-3-methyladenine glycosylase family protein [Fenollaria timonensis]
MNKIILKGQTSFVPSHIFECGQAFRWKKLDEEAYRFIFRDMVLEARATDDNIEIVGNFSDKNEILNYFDLNTDYDALKKTLSANDEVIRKAIDFGGGMRILKQDPFETYISFIISANNQIKNIKNTIKKLSQMYGEKLNNPFDEEEYYAFPSPLELSNAKPEDIKEYARAGFRSERIVIASKMVQEGIINFEELKERSVDDIRKTLLEVPGIGEKVFQCILLFGLGRTDSFPVDVWVKRVMEELYYGGEERNKKLIQEDGLRRFGNLSGYAQQYLFYYMRENYKKMKKEEKKQDNK